MEYDPSSEHDDAPTNRDHDPGIAFPAGNDDFRQARARCAEACHNFNQTPDTNPALERAQKWHMVLGRSQVNGVQKHDLLQQAPSQNGSTTPPNTSATRSPAFTPGAPSNVPGAPYIKPPIHVDYGCRLYIGNTTFINRNCTILDTPVADVRIGERCMFGPNVSIYCVSHCFDWKERLGMVGMPGETEQNRKMRREKGGPSFGKGVSIGDYVWVGGGVTILGGVTIGNGAVIGARSVVTKDVPDGYYARGSPAKLIRLATRSDRDESNDERQPVTWCYTLDEALQYNAAPS